MSYELNTNYIKYLIVEQYGSISHFANAIQVAQETIYYYLRNKKMPSNKLFLIMEKLNIDDVNKLRKES